MHDRRLHRSPEPVQRRAAAADNAAPQTRGPSTIDDWSAALAAPPAQLAAFDAQMSGLHDAVASANQKVWGDAPAEQGVARGARGGGLPADLAAGIESLSGISMADVRVHYGSNKPAALGAHAYAQGSDIHVAPGQEQHLAHEAWHVVQQKQGRVRADVQLKGIGVATDGGLEREADVMGARAREFGRGGARAGATRVVGSGTQGPAQLMPERAFVTRAEGAKVHKSNRKKKGGVATKVSRQTKYQLRHGEEIAVDPAVTVGPYARADYPTDEGTKIGYVRLAAVETVPELAQHPTWEDTGLPVSVLNAIVAELPESDRVFPNKQDKELDEETHKFLSQVAAKMPGFPAPIDDEEDEMSDDEAEPAWAKTARTLTGKNTTRMSRLTKEERAFLAGKVEGMTPKQAYDRGFVCSYGHHPRHFKAMLQQGPVLWTYDVSGKLHIGSEVSDCKHALVGGGKDVWGAGQARLLTELDVAKESGDITEQVMNEFDDICALRKEAAMMADVDPSEVPRVEALLETKLAAFGEERFAEIDHMAATLATKDEKLTVSLDFESGHYQPQQGWKRCTDGWSAAGFNVVWSSTSMRV